MLVDAPFNALTHEIIAAAIEVHRTLGPRLPESIYMPCFRYELAARKLHVEVERQIPIVYKTATLSLSYRVDLIVEGVALVEVKAVTALLSVHDAQLLTYLALTGCPVGLLINFNVAKLTDGVRRLLNTRIKKEGR